MDLHLGKIEQETDLHLGKGAHVPWAILSVQCMQSVSGILNYLKVSLLIFYQSAVSQ